jgi:hypothetical protein
VRSESEWYGRGGGRRGTESERESGELNVFRFLTFLGVRWLKRMSVGGKGLEEWFELEL